MMHAEVAVIHVENSAKFAAQNSLSFEIPQGAKDGKVFSQESVKAILTDIEGTTTSISFVVDVLFPYAKKYVREYVLQHQSDPAVVEIIQEVREAAKTPEADIEGVIATLLSWMEQDKKITPLKTLQGMMWEDGYHKGVFKGHLYEDAYQQLQSWSKQGLSLYVYSSGSVQAQKLLFGHSSFGNITPLFANYFDTKVGNKKESASYTSIAKQIGLDPQAILFLSDSVDELNAAKAAGMQTLLLSRDTAAPANCAHASVASFDQIQIKK